MTYLDAASFAPVLHARRQAHHLRVELRRPEGARVRLWAVDVDGTRPRAHHAPRPASTASRCSRRTASAWRSRRTARPPAGKHDTNVFVARLGRAGRAGRRAPRSAPPIGSSADIALAGRSRARGARRRHGRPRARRAPTSRSASRRSASSPPATTAATGRAFPVTTAVKVEQATALTHRRQAVARDDFQPARVLGDGQGDGPHRARRLRHRRQGARDRRLRGHRREAARSSSCAASSPSTAALVDARGAAPRSAICDRRPGSRASTARAALIVVDAAGAARRTRAADWKPPAEAAAARRPRPSGYGDAGIPVVIVKRAVLGAGDREAGEEASA